MAGLSVRVRRAGCVLLVLAGLAIAWTGVVIGLIGALPDGDIDGPYRTTNRVIVGVVAVAFIGVGLLPTLWAIRLRRRRRRDGRSSLAMR